MSIENPIFFTNIFTLSFSDNDVLIKFGIEDREADTTPKTQVPQTTVIMTPRSAKILATVLNVAIEKFETTAGLIPMAEGQLEKVRAAILSQKAGKREQKA